VNVKIFTSDGKLTESVVSKMQQPGQYHETINLENFPKGTFHCVIFVDGGKVGNKTFIVN
jgi:hypothetical protein